MCPPVPMASAPLALIVLLNFICHFSNQCTAECNPCNRNFSQPLNLGLPEASISLPIYSSCYMHACKTKNDTVSSVSMIAWTTMAPAHAELRDGTPTETQCLPTPLADPELEFGVSHGEPRTRTYNGGWGRAPSRSWDKTFVTGSCQGAPLKKSANSSCNLFFAKHKISSGVWGSCLTGPLDPPVPTTANEARSSFYPIQHSV